MFWHQPRYHRLQQIQALDPVKDNALICRLMVGYEFPWDITRALEVAMVKTYCVPSISELLDRTGEFYHHTQKRYDDTGLLVAEILKWGYDSDRGRASINRMNAIHGHYRISNEDFLYVLSTFIYEPIRWNSCFGWRLFCETEKLGIYYFWKTIGERMNIAAIPGSYEEFDRYKRDYEEVNFRYSDTNRLVAESTVNLFLSWFPALCRPLLKPSLYALFDDRSLEAFGWPEPSPLRKNLVENALKYRGKIARWLPPRNQPEFYTDASIISYPDGYDFKDLGPTSMLKKLNSKL